VKRVNIRDVGRVADLASIEVPPEELEVLTTEIASILEFLEQLAPVGSPLRAKVRTESASEGYSVLREDRVVAAGMRRDPREFAPEYECGMYVVPRPESMSDR